MYVVVAPDKFKGSLTGAEVAEAIAAGLADALPGVRTACIPVADGGEGTLAAALGAGFEPRTATVAGPTGLPLKAEFALKGDTAVVELAAASGLDVLPGGVKDALNASSLGTGELIRAALDAGAAHVVLGVGGSACTDGGAGILAGLGARFLDAAGAELPIGGAALGGLARIDLAGLDPRVAQTRFTLAADVDNVLLGPNGAAAVFGPQKGATAQDVAVLDAALARLVDVLGQAAGPEAGAAAQRPGAGAAGGAGFAAMALLGATRERGIDVVLELTGLPAALQGADAVVTGEGSIDTQTLEGKAPAGVAEAAQALGVEVHAVCGRTLLDPEQLRAAGFASTTALIDIEPDPAVCMADAARLARIAGERIGRRLAAATSEPARA